VNQSHLLVESLKRYLKLKGIRYRELAKQLGQTEANMKRVFSQKSLSLSQLESMCLAAGTDLFELFAMTSTRKPDADFYTEAQEKVLAAQPKLFAFFYLLLADVPLKKIERKYTYSANECQKALLTLDKVGLIRLQEENRFQLLVSKNVRWLDDGPLNRLYHDQIKAEFMDSDFKQANSRMRFLSAPCSDESIALLSRRMDKFISEFSEMAETDRGMDHLGQPVRLLIAYRPWSLSMMDKYRRPS